MEAFRTLIKGWLGKGLLVLFLTPLALVGVEGYFSGPSQAVAMEVNGESITREEVDTWIKSQRDQYLKMAEGDESLLNTKLIEKQVYDSVILRTVLLQQAEKLGLQLTDEQLGALLRQQSAFQRDGKFSQEAFEQYLAGTRKTMQQLLAEFRRDTSLNLMMSSIANTSFYGQKSISTLLDLVAQERITHLAEIPLANFAQNFVANDAQVKAYYDQHQKDYIRSENVDVNYVVLNKAVFAEHVTVNEQDINAAYTNYVASLTKDATREVSHILVDNTSRSDAEAQEIVKQIQAKLNAGDSFETLVQQYSDDPLSKQAKGKIDGYTVGAFGNDFDQSVLDLQQAKISAPVKTEAGYHFIRLDRLVAAAVPTLAEVRDQLVTDIKTQQAENLYQDAINQLNEIALETDALDGLAQQYKLPLNTQKNLVQNNGLPLLSEPAVKVKLFSEEMRQGDRHVSTGISLTSGDTLWFKVIEHRAERVQTLAEAKVAIQAKLKQDEQAKQAKASVSQLLKDFASKPSAEVLANSALQFTNLGPVPRQSGLLPTEIDSAIYTVAKPKSGYWSVNTATVGGSFFVIGVSEISRNPEFTASDEDKKQLVSGRGQQELNDYMEFLKSKAEIEINTKK